MRTAPLWFIACAIAPLACSGDDAPPTPDARVAPDVAVEASSPACFAGQTRCAAGCVNLAADARHCGACDHACDDGERCADGRCALRCPAATVACSEGGVARCVDVLSDRAHCGACGRACADDETCAEGKCVSRCPVNETWCGDVCRALSTDRANCGACANLCALGLSCVEGACVVVCGEGRLNCGGRCVDPLTSNEHCGGCARPCATGTRCMAGVCRGDACGPADSVAGRCDGDAIVRCVDGAQARELCAFGMRCVAAEGASPACAPPSGARRVSGRVTWEMRPVGPAGVGTPRMDATVGVPVALLDAGGRVVAQTLTDAMGAWSIRYDAVDGASMRVRVTTARSDGPYNFVVRDYAGAAYSFTTAPFAAAAETTRDVAVTMDANSGALAIFAAVRNAFDFLDSILDVRPQALYVTWQRGRATGTNNSSYFVGTSSTMFINGSDADPDEFDPSVVSHEFGHYIQRWYSRSDNPGGTHDGRPADPNLAFGEGGATFLGALITGSRYYIDAGVTRPRIIMDLASVPIVRAYAGSTTQPLEQPISEWLVAGAQYAMFRAGSNVEVQQRKAVEVLTRYLRRVPFPDRAEPGADLVEYLDGYLCLHMEAERATIMNYLVNARSFPYDFGYGRFCR